MLTLSLPSSLNDELVIRGRKLVLNYTNGSPCDESHHSSRRRRRAALPSSLDTSLSIDTDTDIDPRAITTAPTKSRRKQTIISLQCEKDISAPPASISFVGTDVDECVYFFEVRAFAACPTVEKAVQTLGPGGVFGVM